MSIEWELPSIGEGVAEADVAEILVSVGDTVAAEQPLMELETEKAVVELPAPHAGKIEKIVVDSGDTIQVGQVYMVVAAEDDAASSPAETEPTTTEEQGTEPEPKAAEPKSEEAPKAASAPTEMVTGEVDFALPPLGEGVDSADVAEILVSEGDSVSAGTPLMELETEKAVVELPSEHTGKVTKIHVNSGDTVSVGQKVISFETSSVVSSGSGDKAPVSTPEKKSSSAASSESPAAAPAKSESQTAVQAPPKQSVAAASEKTAEKTNGIPVPAAPSTRRLARELGVDLTQVKGTGSGGRISADDVQAYVRKRLQDPSGLIVGRSGSSGEMIASGSIAPPPLPDFSKFGAVSREKMNKLSRTAAENLTVSWNVIPHVTQHDRADITDLEAARKRFSKGIGQNGPKVTMTAIVIKALTTCLQGFPKFNSSLDPETNEIVFKKFYNIGCAVDTDHGLLVPVIKNCDKKSILDIAAELTEMAHKARDRKLPVDDMQGATCTVTNLGGIGGVGFTPIVNYPEVCILGMSRGQKELQLVDGNVQERLMLPLSLSYDHRVINGADAARFLVSFCNLLADPFQLLTTV
ncbi:Dihydrolipoyllysine-residue acetyltransferase component of pyruvate dehydrogenase complex [Thalassoglobus neptunius]|uniref:Dihydrolipoamide acetyltransferase component of pyruvate dehydrogenase complex n=1 Tax=Thalassoglobus neptunius TaxID=1938619 RepID=A0A5C5X366_9PLAN|nr:2-oxo acid dehydrogenase subunit E2 [Thalassoglobus neptunius]TWT57396.1 Dihydrolipoyllysine-residue acetyltransferase component of pyruvate dehydrogenase complex [Thalassoglobus neptunius]